MPTYQGHIDEEQVLFNFDRLCKVVVLGRKDERE